MRKKTDVNGLFVGFREVKSQLPSNDSQSLDDFVLMTSFPQRRISDMESTLEAAGKFIEYRARGKNRNPFCLAPSSGGGCK